MTTSDAFTDRFVIVNRKNPERAARVSSQRGIPQGLLVSIRMEMREGRFENARISLQQALSFDRKDPLCRALLGRCKAEIKPDCADAVMLCESAVSALSSAETFYQLGRVYLLNGRRGDAAQAFEEGLAINPTYSPILREFESIGRRRPPVFPFLSRDSLLNKQVGRWLARVGLR